MHIHAYASYKNMQLPKNIIFIKIHCSIIIFGGLFVLLICFQTESMLCLWKLKEWGKPARGFGALVVRIKNQTVSRVKHIHVILILFFSIVKPVLKARNNSIHKNSNCHIKYSYAYRTRWGSSMLLMFVLA